MDINRLPNKLYAVIDISTNELVSNLTSPKHKFWEVKGHCKNALVNYKESYDNMIQRMKKQAELFEKEFNENDINISFYKYNPKNLRMIELDINVNDKQYTIDELNR